MHTIDPTPQHSRHAVDPVPESVGYHLVKAIGCARVAERAWHPGSTAWLPTPRAQALAEARHMGASYGHAFRAAELAAELGR